MKKKQWFAGFVALGLCLGAVGYGLGNLDGLMEAVSRGNGSIPAVAKVESPMVVIDPGHGGEDGGCSAADGTTEKDLNLEMSRSIRDILCALGYDTVLTREEDSLLYDMYGDLENYTGKRKVYDLRNRLRFAHESGAKYLVSIHMNKFADSQYSGLQVYYNSGDGESVSLAGKIQENTKKYIQPKNDRLTKAAGSNIFVLKRAQIPAVLVECGFLSNEEETKNLCDSAYRQRLSLCIALSIAESLENGAKNGLK